MTLDSFIRENHLNLSYFKRAYIQMNVEDPKNFPLEMHEDELGLWSKYFETFKSTGTVDILPKIDYNIE